MREYASWSERVISLDGLPNVLLAGMFLTALLAPVLARRFPPGAHIFNLLVLGFCPVLCAWLYASLRVDALRYEDPSLDYVDERFALARRVVLFGAALAALSMGAVTAIHLRKRKAADFHPTGASGPSKAAS
jgi:hypothetical protein